MYKAVHDKNKQLTQAEKEAAIWWANDPSLTFTPPGHSYNLAGIAIRTTNADLVQAVETYARVGMAVADAFVCCFRVKYTYYTNKARNAVTFGPDSNTARTGIVKPVRSWLLTNSPTRNVPSWA